MPRVSCAVTPKAWWVLAAAALAGGLFLVGDATRDLLRRPAFDGVLRLVIEAIASAVMVGWAVTRARSGSSGGGGPDGGKHRENRERDRQ